MKKVSMFIFAVTLFLILTSALAADAGRAYRSGMAYFKKGAYEFALLQFQHIIEVSPDSKLADEAQFRVGEIHYLQQMPWDAEKALKKHLENYPQSKFKIQRQAYLDQINRVDLIKKGDSLYSQEQWDQALTVYGEALKLNPELASLEEKIKQCYERIEDSKSSSAKKTD